MDRWIDGTAVRVRKGLKNTFGYCAERMLSSLDSSRRGRKETIGIVCNIYVPTVPCLRTKTDPMYST